MQQKMYYNAELVEKYNKKRFVIPAYESKNTEWKQGFRAGREVTGKQELLSKSGLMNYKLNDKPDSYDVVGDILFIKK